MNGTVRLHLIRFAGKARLTYRFLPDGSWRMAAPWPVRLWWRLSRLRQQEQDR